jgi:Dienelactone hydrolase family
MGEMLTLTAEDGHRLSAYRAMPAGKPRGGIVVVQEIFGVNSHIKNVTDGFAADGYVALAPALFDRVERGFETGYQPADIERGRMVRGKLQIEDAVKDTQAAVKELQKAGLKVGVVGYCFGGTIAWLAATRIDGVVAASAFGRRAAEVPGDLALRRNGPVDPQGALGSHQGAASEDPDAHLSGRPRLQLRRARVLSRAEREAGTPAYDRLFPPARRLVRRLAGSFFSCPPAHAVCPYSVGQSTDGARGPDQ